MSTDRATVVSLIATFKLAAANAAQIQDITGWSAARAQVRELEIRLAGIDARERIATTRARLSGGLIANNSAN